MRTSIVNGRIGVLLMAIGLAFDAQAGALARLTAALPDAPEPPVGGAFWIAPSMRMNGLPMTLKGFQSRLSPDELLDFYRSQMAQRSGHEYRYSRNDEWQILSIRASRYHITVQARATPGGSDGTILVSGAPGSETPVITTDFPHPDTTRLLSRQEYDDAGIESEHLSLSSLRPVGVEAQAFVTELDRAGWQIVRRQGMQATKRGVVVEAQHDTQQALLVLQPDRRNPASTAIVIVWRKT
ncbi:MAG TPA: hypothetical protein VNQ81_05545 [Povalibacter sp.]|nr:hypothetical protein [Povalibacter sp.]